jgi:N,N'-diacetyllegionaminate synthase
MKGLAGRAGEDACYVIGEVGQTHDGSLGLAHALVDAVAETGADAVKFQTHIAAAESTTAEPWRQRFSSQDATRYDYWRRTEFTENEWRGLRDHAIERQIDFVSSPFSVEAAELLDRVGTVVWKLPSGEIANPELLDRMLELPRPLLLSTGMSQLKEIDAAVERVNASHVPFAVLQCTTAYPCPPEKIGLNMLTILRQRYGSAVGLSDHSGTIYAGLAAAVLGADVLETHVTLTREMFGPDVPASVTTDELHQLVKGVRFIERIMANPVDKDALAEELGPLYRLFTKSVVARSDLIEGTVLGREHLAVKKPGTGIPAIELKGLIGRRLRRPLRRDELLAEADVE